jgi:hypothetical protein
MAFFAPASVPPDRSGMSPSSYSSESRSRRKYVPTRPPFSDGCHTVKKGGGAGERVRVVETETVWQIESSQIGRRDARLVVGLWRRIRPQHCEQLFRRDVESGRRSAGPFSPFVPVTSHPDDVPTSPIDQPDRGRRWWQASMASASLAADAT